MRHNGPNNKKRSKEKEVRGHYVAQAKGIYNSVSALRTIGPYISSYFLFVFS
jgi:hypothetical protein